MVRHFVHFVKMGGGGVAISRQNMVKYNVKPILGKANRCLITGAKSKDEINDHV